MIHLRTKILRRKNNKSQKKEKPMQKQRKKKNTRHYRKKNETSGHKRTEDEWKIAKISNKNKIKLILNDSKKHNYKIGEKSEKKF